MSQHQLLRKFYGEVLPYLEIEKEEEIKPIVEMPDVTGISIKEAKQKIEEAGLTYTISGETNNDIVIDQIPKKGIQISEETEVILYVE